MGEHITRDEEGREHLRARSERYPEAVNIEPGWTQEVFEDPVRMIFDPDPQSGSGAVRLIGYSRSAGAVISVIAHRDPDGELHGVAAFPISGRDLRDCERRAR